MHLLISVLVHRNFVMNEILKFAKINKHCTRQCMQWGEIKGTVDDISGSPFKCKFNKLKSAVWEGRDEFLLRNFSTLNPTVGTAGIDKSQIRKKKVRLNLIGIHSCLLKATNLLLIVLIHVRNFSQISFRTSIPLFDYWQVCIMCIFSWNIPPPPL